MRGPRRRTGSWSLPATAQDGRLVDDLASGGFCAVEVDTAGLTQPAITLDTLTQRWVRRSRRSSDGQLVAFDLRGRPSQPCGFPRRSRRHAARRPGASPAARHVVTATMARLPETSRRPSRLVSTWAPLGVVALVPLFLLFGRSHQIGDPDTFWHIRAGDYLLQTWQFAGPDPWSPFTANAWVLHEWVPELALSLAYRVDGLTGVAWAWYVGTVLVALAFYVSCRSQGRIVLSAIATVLALLGAAASLTPRPQLVSIALAAVVTAAWLSTARDGRARWWLVPMTWVWACSHGMWFVSPLVGCAVVLGLLLNRDRAKPLRRLGAVALSCVLVAAITPAGPSLLLAPLSVSGYTRFVSEWDPPRLTSPPVAVTVLLLVGRRSHLGPLRASRLVGPRAGLDRRARVGPRVYADRRHRRRHGRTSRRGGRVECPAPGAGREPPEPATRRAPVEWLTLAASLLVGAALAAVILPATTATPDRMPVGLDAALDRLPSGHGGHERVRARRLPPVPPSGPRAGHRRTDRAVHGRLRRGVPRRPRRQAGMDRRSSNERAPRRLSCRSSRRLPTPFLVSSAGGVWAQTATTFSSWSRRPPLADVERVSATPPAESECSGRTSG